MRVRGWLWSIVLLLWSATIGAAPLQPESVPAPLQPWVEWVGRGSEPQLHCPAAHGDWDRRLCHLPTMLNLQLDGRGGTFTQTWRVFHPGWVTLPGDALRWPLDIQVDGQPAWVIPRAGRPSVHLQTGAHTLVGRFLWDRLPESLQVPVGTGILDLVVSGEAVRFPDRDDSGRVWLRGRARAEEGVADPDRQRDAIDLVVHRRVTDAIPLTLTTRLELHVAGQKREIRLGRALTQGFVPMSLEGNLPARVEADGRLRIQARPGRWKLVLVARHEGPVDALTVSEPDGPWVPEEVWVFEAQNHLRQVRVDGVTSLDPQQTTLPDDWKQFPAYRMRPGDIMKLVEQRRGDPDPAPDRLSLARAIWLDFDGRGLTLQDTITGTMNRSWRLEMTPPTRLGRVSVDGKDQFITRMAQDGPVGVEIRQGKVRVVAESRVQGEGVGRGRVPAVSWDHDFTAVSGVLNLPPGWRLFDASGVDRVPQTWLKSWTLLDLFLALIIAMAIGRLWGWPWGVLAIATLTMTIPERNGPELLWLAVLAGEALARLLPKGWFRRVVLFARLGAVVALVVASLGFMAQQVRQGIYPALEYPWRSMGYDEAAGRPPPIEPVANTLPQQKMQKQPVQQQQVQQLMEIPQLANQQLDLESESLSSYSLSGRRKKPSTRTKLKKSMFKGKRVRNLQQHDPDVVVQTGPGLPSWQWRSIPLQWSGPVDRSQQLELSLIPPWLNLMLAGIRVLLLLGLVLCVVRNPRRLWPGRTAEAMAHAGAVGIVLALGLAMLTPARAETPSAFPPAELLETLRKGLLEPPTCAPTCAASHRLMLEASPDALQLRVGLDAAASTAVPLPGSLSTWSPSRVILDGAPAEGLWRGEEGRLWLWVGPGRHQILLSGPLPNREVIQLPLSHKPHRVEARAKGWSVEGLHEDGLADDHIQLTRLRDAKPSDQGPVDGFEPGALPPFVRVERALLLALSWQTVTRVQRLTPTGSAVVLEVPLLAGESVLSEDVRVVGGKALVNMAPHQTQVEWVGDLDETKVIELRAPDRVAWTEVWRLDVGPIWHVGLTGIPVVHHRDQAGVRLPEWRPWPGEQVKIEVTRPAGVPGRTLTIERSQLLVRPGLRATDVTLTLHPRSSRGGQHSVTLPPGTDLQSVSIDGRSLPVRQADRKVTLPLRPGAQTVKLEWRESRGISTRFQLSEVDLGTESVNADLRFVTPQGRWVLFVFGPRMGPAVLLWSLVFVLLLAAIGLSRIPLTPLKLHHWLLLGVGLSQTTVFAAAVVGGWLLALGWRGRPSASASSNDDADFVSNAWFDLRQLFLVGWTIAALIILFWSIHAGLLGMPNMQITGNGSHHFLLRWFQDRTDSVLPRPWVVTVPLMVYRIAMLAWALWLAVSLLRWLRWGWGCFAESGLWRRIMPRAKRA